MVLKHLGLTLSYPDLLELLKIRSYGAPAGNIRLIAQLGLSVTYSVTDLPGLIQLLEQGSPVIVFLRTGDLPYWKYNTDHAIVVTGYDSEAHQLFVHDPYANEAPIAVTQGDFELAWSERDYHFATITR
jgi:uncharacterized protein YvpB